VLKRSCVVAERGHERVDLIAQAVRFAGRGAGDARLVRKQGRPLSIAVDEHSPVARRRVEEQRIGLCRFERHEVDRASGSM
jgi:hypothetical protein